MNGVFKDLGLLIAVIIILSLIIVVLIQPLEKDIDNINKLINNKELEVKNITDDRNLIGRLYYSKEILVASDKLNSIDGSAERFYYDKNGRKFASVSFDHCMNPLTTRYYDVQGNITNEIIPAIQPICSASIIW